MLKTQGSVELLQLGNAQMFWRELRLEPSLATFSSEVDLEPSPPKAGKQPQGPLLSLGAGQVSPEPTARTIIVYGQTATLTAPTAEPLNTSFSDGKSTFAAGETVGRSPTPRRGTRLLRSAAIPRKPEAPSGPLREI